MLCNWLKYRPKIRSFDVPVPLRGTNGIARSRFRGAHAALRNKCRVREENSHPHAVGWRVAKRSAKFATTRTTKLCPVQIASGISSPCDSSWRGQDWWKGAFLSELIGTQRAILAILCADKSWLP